MKSKIIILLFIASLPAFGQKEVYFSDTVVANKKIQSLHGIEVSAIPNKLGNSFRSTFGDHFNISGYIGYFYEGPIARTLSIIFTAGIHNVSYMKIIYYNYNYYNLNDYTYERSYKAIFHIGAEPRWYYSFNKRYDIGKSRLNSGWFLGCPVSIEYFSNAQLHITPSLGFRQSLSNHLFLEAEAGVGTVRYLFELNKQFSFDHFVSAKIAYTF